jgi:hypothetical protein
MKVDPAPLIKTDDPEDVAVLLSADGVALLSPDGVALLSPDAAAPLWAGVAVLLPLDDAELLPQPDASSDAVRLTMAAIAVMCAREPARSMICNSSPTQRQFSITQHQFFVPLLFTSLFLLCPGTRRTLAHKRHTNVIVKSVLNRSKMGVNCAWSEQAVQPSLNPPFMCL